MRMARRTTLHEPRQGDEHQALEERQARSAQRAVVQEQGLDAAPAPAFPLHEVAFEILGRETHREALVEVARLVALVEHRQGGEQVLGDAFGRKAADRLHGRAAGDRARAAAEAHVPGVAARRDLVEEQALLVGPDPLERQVRLHGVLVEEMLRRLHDADGGVREERQGSAQEVAVGDEVRVEHRDELA